MASNAQAAGAAWRKLNADYTQTWRNPN